jgi:hypothetical protein
MRSKNRMLETGKRKIGNAKSRQRDFQWFDGRCLRYNQPNFPSALLLPMPTQTRILPLCRETRLSGGNEIAGDPLAQGVAVSTAAWK